VQTLVSERFQLGKEVAFQKKEVSPTLGSAFYRTAFNVGIVAMVLITIVIFIFFRQVVPSAAVIASAGLDIVGALGLMALFQIPLTLSSIPALLMLIGYSVDTDVMLTTKLLKRREQSKDQRVYDSLITGLTMNATTIAALLAMLALSFTSQMLVVFEISAVLLFGLIIDLSSTWFMNAPVLLWYVERREKV
jgi:preprotein translocase subunit SecF